MQEKRPAFQEIYHCGRKLLWPLKRFSEKVNLFFILPEEIHLSAIFFYGELVLVADGDYVDMGSDESLDIKHFYSIVYKAQAKKQNVQIETQFEKDLPKLFCDSAELRQVLINLVLNGMQAMPDGGPRIA